MATVENSDKFYMIFSAEEKIACLKQLLKKHKKILYVYEQTFKPDSTYDYKMYVRSLILYTATSNSMLDGELMDIIINLHSIEQNDLTKNQIRKLVLENNNILHYLLSKVGGSNAYN